MEHYAGYIGAGVALLGVIMGPLIWRFRVVEREVLGMRKTMHDLANTKLAALQRDQGILEERIDGIKRDLEHVEKQLWRERGAE